MKNLKKLLTAFALKQILARTMEFAWTQTLFLSAYATLIFMELFVTKVSLLTILARLFDIIKNK